MKLYEVDYFDKLKCDKVFAAYVNFDKYLRNTTEAAISIFDGKNIRYVVQGSG